MASGAMGYYQDQISHPLTSSFVSYSFMLMTGYLRIDNDDTAGTNKVQWSFDGVNVQGAVIPGKYVEIQDAHVGAIYLRFLTGAPAYRLNAVYAG